MGRLLTLCIPHHDIRRRVTHAVHDPASIQVHTIVRDEEDGLYCNRVVYPDEDESPGQTHRILRSHARYKNV